MWYVPPSLQVVWSCGQCRQHRGESPFAWQYRKQRIKIKNSEVDQTDTSSQKESQNKGMRKTTKNYLNSLHSGPTKLSKWKSHSARQLPELVNHAWRSLEMRGSFTHVAALQPAPAPTSLGQTQRWIQGLAESTVHSRAMIHCFLNSSSVI